MVGGVLEAGPCESAKCKAVWDREATGIQPVRTCFRKISNGAMQLWIYQRKINRHAVIDVLGRECKDAGHESSE